MTEDIVVHKVKCYVNEEGFANLSCPQCGFLKTIDLATLNLTQNNFKTTCKCGAVLRGQFEFRSHYRKKVRLAGEYWHAKDKTRGQILVEDISFMGLGFSCMDKHHLQQGNRLKIAFRLDNGNRPEINLRVEVKHVRGQFIGVKRCDIQSDQPDLGFYLR